MIWEHLIIRLHIFVCVIFRLDQGGNNGDDADMPDGNKFPYQVETGERSSDGDKNVKENLTAAAPKKRTHRPTYATKKVPVAWNGITIVVVSYMKFK